MNLIRAVSVGLLLFASSINANYIYEANQSLIDLRNETDATNMAAGDDQVSNPFDLGFTFTFYGEDFTTARMATNGCLHFGSTGSHCNDYTPDPLPEVNYTLYPFWTDLIRDNGSKVLAKNFTDKSVFGWYDLREYHRQSDNSFEVILWKSDDSYEFRYGALDIIQHDVLIGEQGKSDEIYTYYYHDECNTGTTNSATCYNYDWNNSDKNTNLENGGSLYKSTIDCSNPLNDASCAGYDSAYLLQQCNIDGLYSDQCPGYWQTLFDYKCETDPQHSPACPSYQMQTYVYEYEEDYYGYEINNNEYLYDFYEEEQIYQELYMPDDELLEFVEEHHINDEYHEPIIETNEIDNEIIVENIVEQDYLLVEQYRPTETIIPDDFLLNHFEVQEHIERWIDDEEIFIENEKEISILDDEQTTEEASKDRDEDSKDDRAEKKKEVLDIVERVLKVATNSTSNNNTDETQTQAINKNNTTKSKTGLSSNSVSNSPSISAQIESSVLQTDQILDSFNMSEIDTSMGDINITIAENNSQDTTDTTASVDNTNTANEEISDNQTMFSMVDENEASEADMIASEIVAQNIQGQQEELEQQQQETGEYADSSQLVALMGYVPGFNSYRQIQIPNASIWYESEEIYTNVSLSDNNQAFTNMYGNNLTTINDMVQSQPNL